MPCSRWQERQNIRLRGWQAELGEHALWPYLCREICRSLLSTPSRPCKEVCRLAPNHCRKVCRWHAQPPAPAYRYAGSTLPQQGGGQSVPLFPCRVATAAGTGAGLARHLQQAQTWADRGWRASPSSCPFSPHGSPLLWCPQGKIWSLTNINLQQYW